MVAWTVLGRGYDCLNFSTFSCILCILPVAFYVWVIKWGLTGLFQHLSLKALEWQPLKLSISQSDFSMIKG